LALLFYDKSTVELKREQVNQPDNYFSEENLPTEILASLKTQSPRCEHLQLSLMHRYSLSN